MQNCDAKSLEYFDWQRGTGEASEWLKNPVDVTE